MTEDQQKQLTQLLIENFDKLRNMPEDAGHKQYDKVMASIFKTTTLLIAEGLTDLKRIANALEEANKE